MAAEGTFGYFTFNFVSSALTALRRPRQLRKRASGVRAAGRREKGRPRESRVEIMVATLIICSLPAEQLWPVPRVPSDLADDRARKEKRDQDARSQRRYTRCV